jgi:uncharacterized membrane protein YhaH (DUF805 family)
MQRARIRDEGVTKSQVCKAVPGAFCSGASNAAPPLDRRSKPMPRLKTASAHLILMISLVLCTSCEKPQEDFVDGTLAGTWNNIVVLSLDSGAGAEDIVDIKEWLSRDPSTVAVTAFSEIPSKTEATATLYFAGEDSDTGVIAHVEAVDSDFRAAFGLQVVTGRFFASDSRWDAAAVVINEATASQLLLNDQSGRGSAFIVGERITLEVGSERSAANIVGVIEDYRFRPGSTVEPVPLVFRMSPEHIDFIAIQTDDIGATSARVQERWQESLNGNPPEMFILSDVVTDFEAIWIRNQIVRRSITFGLVCAAHAYLAVFVLILLSGVTFGRRRLIMKDLFRMRGRVARGNFASVTLVTMFVNLAFLVLIEETSYAWYAYIPTVVAYVLAAIVQTFNIVKRLHDLGKPGVRYWLLLVPFYNLYLSWVLLLRKGTDGANRYGEDPLTPLCPGG